MTVSGSLGGFGRGSDRMNRDEWARALKTVAETFIVLRMFCAAFMFHLRIFLENLIWEKHPRASSAILIFSCEYEGVDLVGGEYFMSRLGSIERAYQN